MTKKSKSFKIEIEVFNKYRVKPPISTIFYDEKSNFPQVQCCLNSKCLNGGYFLAQKMEELFENKQTNFQERVGCPGIEKGSDQFTCVNGFEVKIEIEYP